jgi:hypothetical protein
LVSELSSVYSVGFATPDAAASSLVVMPGRSPTTFRTASRLAPRGARPRDPADEPGASAAGDHLWMQTAPHRREPRAPLGGARTPGRPRGSRPGVHVFPVECGRAGQANRTSPRLFSRLGAIRRAGRHLDGMVTDRLPLRGRGVGVAGRSGFPSPTRLACGDAVHVALMAAAHSLAGALQDAPIDSRARSAFSPRARSCASTRTGRAPGSLPGRYAGNRDGALRSYRCRAGSLDAAELAPE